MAKHGPVNHPSHYTAGGIEVIDFIDAWSLGFYEGNVIKYVTRAAHKGNEIQDLEKAEWYLRRLITNKKGKANGRSRGSHRTVRRRNAQ